MLDTALSYLSGLPAFASYFGIAILLLAAFGCIYSLLTPHHEWTLIRNNVPAAALAYGGSLLGFVLPLASAISHSVSVLDCLVWGLVAFIVQLLTFVALRLLIPDLPKRISNNEMASGIFVAFTALSVGVLNAASMTY